MRTLKFLLLLFFSVIASCQSDDNDQEPADTTFVRATIDGTNWEASAFQGSYINDIVSIEADGPNNTTIEISVQNVSGTGSHTLGNVSIGAYEEGSGNDETYTTAGTLGTGTINFSVLTTSRAEGTFSFTGGNGLGDSKTIGSGTFKINMTN